MPLGEPGVPRGRADICFGKWHLIHETRTSPCPPPAIASRRATWVSTSWMDKWASMIATRDENNEVWIIISAYLPCVGRGTPTFIEATDEIEVMAMEAPARAHDYGRRLRCQAREAEAVRRDPPGDDEAERRARQDEAGADYKGHLHENLNFVQRSLA